jgi:integrase
VPTKTKRLRYARKFLRGLASLGLIPVPPNLLDRLRFKASVRDIPMPDAAEISRVIGEAPGQLKLHMLLMLNCGFTQVDISDLRQDEVDWERGRIRRKRSKTRDQESVPVVDDPLWAGTFSLLRKYRQGDGELALRTESGRAWVRDSIDSSGRRHKVDVIASNYAHLRRRLSTPVLLKSLRKAGASLLADHREYAPFKERYLGHALASIADRHYVAGGAGQEHFDEAIRWLGERFDFAPHV